MKFNLLSLVAYLWLIVFAGASEVVKLDFPNFSEIRVIDNKMGMKYFDHITIKSKVHYYNEKPILVIDNYGYGENIWSYAPGSAELSYELMLKGHQLLRKQIVPSEETVTILGGGVNSLMLANRLAESGYSVVIYAEAFSPNTLSDVKIGIFIPQSGEEKTNNIKNRIEEYSYNAYKKWSEATVLGTQEGAVRPIDLYIVKDDGEVDSPKARSEIPMPSVVDIEMDYKQKIASLRYKSFSIDTHAIMKELMEKGQKLGVKFIKRKINSLKEVMGERSSLIFNCVGADFKEKQEVISLISHTISIDAGTPIDYAIYAKHANGSYTYLFPEKNNVIRVTGTFFSELEKNGPEEETIKRLVARANSLLRKK